MILIKNPLTLWLKHTFNNFKIEKINKSKSLKIGYMSIISKCTFGKFNTIGDYVNISNVKLDDLSYIVSKTSIKNTTIGKFCSIGPNCLIGLGKHPSKDFISTHPIFFSPLKQAQISFCNNSSFEEFQDIIIENDVWIGANVIILDGIKIKTGAIVAAGSIVTKDVPPYGIVGGNPAKLIKYRFSESEIEYLLESKWWEKDLIWLKENYKSFFTFNQFKEI